MGPDDWLEMAPRVGGSWWPEWMAWLTAQSGEPCDPPRVGTGDASEQGLPEAPGDYVRQP
jgi:polyhydroxyalkanoate synthase